MIITKKENENQVKLKEHANNNKMNLFITTTTTKKSQRWCL